MSRSVARICMVATFFVGLNQHAAAAGPAANEEAGGGEELELSNPVTLQARAGLDPTLALDTRSGALYVAWARRVPGAEAAPLEVVVARSADGGRSFADPVVASGGDRDIASATVDPAQIAVGPQGEVVVLYHRQIASKVFERGRSIPRLTRSADGARSFSPAVDVTAREVIATSAAMTGLSVASDGTVYIGWLDERKLLARSELPEDQRPEDVAWRDSDDPQVQVRVARAGPRDLRFGLSVVVADSASERSRISIATDTQGSLSAAWRSKLDQFKGSYDSVRDILVSTSTDGGMSWSKPVKVHDDRFKAGDCPELTIGTGFDTKGTFHLAWYTGTGVAPGVYYAVSEDRGRSFSKPLPLLTDTWVPYADVKLAMDEEDAAWVAFEDRRDDRAEQVTVARIDRQGRVSSRMSWPGSAPDIAAQGDAADLAWVGAGGAIQIMRVTP